MIEKLKSEYQKILELNERAIETIQKIAPPELRQEYEYLLISSINESDYSLFCFFFQRIFNFLFQKKKKKKKKTIHSFIFIDRYRNSI